MPKDSTTAGLAAEPGHQKPRIAGDEKSPLERDADELVHEQQHERPVDAAEHDLDEVVHEQNSILTDKEAEEDVTDEEDIDDLVHRSSTDADADDH
jgi:hypothetical protein